MPEPLLPVSSQRVTLRRLCVQDKSAFMAYRSDPEVARYQGWEPMDAARAEDFLSSVEHAPLLQPGQWSQLALAAKDDGTLLGDVGIHMSKDESSIELGITLSRDAQGKGIGEEAVRLVCGWLWQATRADRIEAITMAENTRALALLERTPFSFVKTTTEAEDGTLLVEHWYEWRRS